MIWRRHRSHVAAAARPPYERRSMVPPSLFFPFLFLPFPLPSLAMLFSSANANAKISQNALLCHQSISIVGISSQLSWSVALTAAACLHFALSASATVTTSVSADQRTYPSSLDISSVANLVAAPLHALPPLALHVPPALTALLLVGFCFADRMNRPF